MRRNHVTRLYAVTLALGIALTPARGLAQATAPGGDIDAELLLPPRETTPPAARAPGEAVLVRLRARDRKVSARLSIRQPDGSYTFVCASPCTTHVAVNGELRVTLANKENDVHDFVVPASLGPAVDLDVRPASIGMPIAGGAILGQGGGLVLLGVLLSVLPEAGSSSGFRLIEGNRKVGLVCIGIGVAEMIVGSVLLLARPHEPRVIVSPQVAPEVSARHDTLLGDVAVQKRREALSWALPTSSPLELLFTF